MILFKCTIPGRVAIKKNSKRIMRNGRTGRVWIGSSERHEAWTRTAVLYIAQARKGASTISEPLEARLNFYFKNHHAEPDTSNCIEAPQDALKKAGVISDDKIIKRVIAEKFFGEEPRCEIELRVIA